MIPTVSNFMRDEKGSAITEFVLLALPLFVPLFLFLGDYGQKSDMESSMRILGREMARAFVISSDDDIAREMTFEVFQKGAQILGLAKEVENGNLTYSVDCKESPCISPDSAVVVTLHLDAPEMNISTLEYVSHWA